MAQSLKKALYVWLQVIVGVATTIVGATGGMYGIIQNSRSKVPPFSCSQNFDIWPQKNCFPHSGTRHRLFLPR